MVDMGHRAKMMAIDNPNAFWKQSTDFLRGLSMVPEAQANAWLLDEARDHWVSTVIARTSMHSLLFTIPGDAYPFDRTVRVSWSADVYEFQLQERGKPVVTADRCFAANALVVLDAFLYQLAGAEAPANVSRRSRRGDFLARFLTAARHVIQPGFPRR
jgi:hypothetical protein